jgi:uncharacterized protein YxjI
MFNLISTIVRARKAGVSTRPLMRSLWQSACTVTTTTLALALCAVLLCSLTGCGDPSASNYGNGGNVSGSAGAQAQQPSGPPDLPKNFKVVERFISFGTVFDLLDNSDKKLGTIAEKIFTLTREFTYDDSNGRRIATARERFFSWGAQVDVFDEAGRPIGTIKEDVLKSFFKPLTTYSILDGSGKQIATSEKVDLWATDFTLKDGSGQTVATIHRPALNFFRDVWTVSIDNQSKVDSRLLVMIAAYKTAKDHDRAKSDD